MGTQEEFDAALAVYEAARDAQKRAREAVFTPRETKPGILLMSNDLALLEAWDKARREEAHALVEMGRICGRPG